MLPSQIEFKQAIAALRSHVEFLRALEAALAEGVRLAETAATPSDRLLVALRDAASKTTPRRFSHTLIVVELYGAIEQLVEGLVRDYLSRIQQIYPDPRHLPLRFHKTHERKSAELLLAADRLPFQVSAREVVANLHACAQSAGPYRLNADAFAMRTANMRTAQIRSLFSDMGVENITRRAREAIAFQLYLRRKGDRRERLTRVAEFPELEELVSYRNEAAHGRPSNVLSPPLLMDYIEFAEALGAALDDAVEGASVDAALDLAPQLGVLQNVYNSRIVCVALAVPIAIGDTIAARAGSKLRFGTVSKVEIDHNSVTSASPGELVGLEVSFTAKKNHSFYKLPW